MGLYPLLKNKSKERVDKISAHYDSPDEPQTLVQDILADLRHYCDAHDLDWNVCLSWSRSYYLDELESDLADNAPRKMDSMITLSTAHVTLEDDTLLAAYAQEHVADPDGSSHFIFPTGYGYVVWVNPDGDFSEYDDSKLSSHFIELLKRAHRSGAEFLRLDRDAPVDADTPAFDW